MTRGGSIESALRHDRIIVLAAAKRPRARGAASFTCSARRARWTPPACVQYCAGLAMSGPDVKSWAAGAILPLFLMWAEMMVAMMIPSAAPMILTFAMINRKRSRGRKRPFVRTGLFLLGYFIVWTVFSFVAAVAQWALHGVALLSPMMKSSSPILAGALLIGAGIFQWTRWKRVCVNHCRSPLEFLLHDWRDGPGGALAMGAKHGTFCAGCCWMLMALLFVAGVMNMLWIARRSRFSCCWKRSHRGAGG